MKPDVVVPVLKEVKDLPASKNKLFISVAMGVSTKAIEKVSQPYLMSTLVTTNHECFFVLLRA